MPWTDAANFLQGARIVGSAARDNAGLLIDPIHFDRGGSVAAEIGTVPPTWLRYIQMCDAPAERPTTLEGLLHQARAERLLPGEGGLDLSGILRTVPARRRSASKIPQEALARTVPAVERARRALAATRRLVSSLH